MKTPTFQEIKEEMYSGQSRPITTEDHLKYFYGAFVKLLNKEKSVDLKQIQGSGKELFDGIRN